MWVQVLIYLVLTVTLGLFVTWRIRGRVVKTEHVAPLWIGAACAVVIALSGVVYLQRLRDYDLCAQRAERSVGFVMWANQLMDTFDAGYGTDHWTSDEILAGRQSLRDSLAEDLPLLSVSDCVHP